MFDSLLPLLTSAASLLRDLIGVGLGWGFLWFALVRATGLKRWLAALVTGLLALWGGTGLIAISVSRTWGVTSHPLWLIVTTASVAVLLYLGIGLVVVQLVNLVWWLVERRPATATPEQTDAESVTRQLSRASASRDRRRVVRALTVVALVVALAVTGWGFTRAERPSLTRIDLTLAELPPEFDGLTIALVTDLHIGATSRAWFLPGVVDQVNAAQPDLIVIAGDLEDGPVSKLGARMAELSRLQAELGVVMTTGNHEFNSDARGWLDYFSSIGLRTLDNDGFTIRRGEALIEVLGVNDYTGTGRLEPDPATACRRAHGTTCTSDDQIFRILAAHQPRQVTTDGGAASIGVDLQLSGHTHGGQLWPLGYLVRLEQPMLSGVAQIGPVTVVTSRGAGSWGPPIRVGADPEIPLITLHAA